MSDVFWSDWCSSLPHVDPSMRKGCCHIARVVWSHVSWSALCSLLTGATIYRGWVKDSAVAVQGTHLCVPAPIFKAMISSFVFFLCAVKTMLNPIELLIWFETNRLQRTCQPHAKF
eukprot:1160410-Pelagomonas_calceolata.AAC.9